MKLNNKFLFIIGALGLLGLLLWLQNRKSTSTKENSSKENSSGAEPLSVGIASDAQLITKADEPAPDWVKPEYANLYRYNQDIPCSLFGVNGKVAVFILPESVNDVAVGSKIIFNIGNTGPYTEPFTVLSKNPGVNPFATNISGYILSTDGNYDQNAGGMDDGNIWVLS